MFTREMIEQAAVEAMKPTGVKELDDLFAEYNQNSIPDDWPHYYRFLYRLPEIYACETLNSLQLVELGCNRGFATVHFLRGGGRHSAMIDVENRFSWDHFKFVDTLVLFTQTKSTSPVAVEAGLMVGRPDIILVDSDHSYNTTRDEFNLWYPLLKPGGLMLFDDVQAYDYFHREDFACGRFWNELPDKVYGEKIQLNQLHPTGWGFAALIKKG